MKILPPLEITPSLEPGFRMAGAWVSISYASRPGDVVLKGYRERTRYRWRIILPDHTEHTSDDLQSGGLAKHGLQYGLENLLCFLSSAVESYRYYKRDWKVISGEDESNLDATESTANTFPRAVVEWADTCIDDLDMMRLDLEEQKGIINENN